MFCPKSNSNLFTSSSVEGGVDTALENDARGQICKTTFAPKQTDPVLMAGASSKVSRPHQGGEEGNKGLRLWRAFDSKI